LCSALDTCPIEALQFASNSKIFFDGNFTKLTTFPSESSIVFINIQFVPAALAIFPPVFGVNSKL
jgi:hypothetical protein